MKVHVVGAAIVHEGRCLVARRPEGGSAGGKWEFPGGKKEPGESEEQALRREIEEELALEIKVGAFIGSGSARAGERQIELRVFRATLVSAAPQLELREHTESSWTAPEQLCEFDWADADIPVWPEVRKMLVGEKP